jgi:serine/threonine protein kinase
LTHAVLAAGTLVAGKLRVLRLLGMGGMGSVYEVEHELTKHRRALKMLHAQFSAYPSVVARFLREASAAGRIGNPHIIETFDAGELEGGEPYLVMEYLEGETLSDLLGKHGQLPVAELADLMIQACTGVQAAHDRGIVHRDLKPDNLFIISREGRPFLKLLDFGVSKFDAELTGGLGMTKEGVTLGTPFYMPPEQVRGEKDIDARADVYALGVILYECVTGKRPFEADTLPHLALLIHEGKATPIEELRPDLPAGFADVVRRAMATQREQRYATARELATELAPFTRTRQHEPAAHVSDAEALSATVPGESSLPPGRAAKSGRLALVLIAAALLVVVLVALVLKLSAGEPLPSTSSLGKDSASAQPGAHATEANSASAQPGAHATAALTGASSAAIALSANAVSTSTPTPANAASGPSAASANAALANAAPASANLAAGSGGAAISGAHPPNARPLASTATPGRSPSRVDQKGLAGDNPFK